eukprot:TRINITY_DN66724_c4_g7_i1.p2 TRINITY_DN66724_c4_g7~~TRINITY_DN66724_c4_g7_i1.p2  ORF type:complete len:369 (-),score=229.68 TRINITY_DN66724_c4_g7_i1:139-1245(-)
MSGILSSTWNAVVKLSTGKSSKEQDALNEQRVAGVVDGYADLFDESDKGRDQQAIKKRQKNYEKLVNSYYDLVTDFYEYGWGQSFHFATRFKGESFDASIARHEHYLALRAGLKRGDKVLDVGCGVGGPMRAIARFSECQVIGVNNNQYQVGRCNILNARAHLAKQCEAVKGDFMNLPFEAGSFDACYAIEATCHAPDKVGCYSQMFKVLKPGGVFVGYEWVMTDKYDEKDEEHRRIKHVIEVGDGLPDLARPQDVKNALEKAGFVVEIVEDLAETAEAQGYDLPWYATLQGGIKLSQIKHSKIGRFATQKAVDVMEAIKIAPKGTSKTHKILTEAADALAAGGEKGIFTPMLFFRAYKPVNGKKKGK